jgi:pimeloyl-ACP methyl ester carboxylesterase
MGKKSKPLTYHALTNDRWKIALHRYSQNIKGRSPVLLVHGFASNRHDLDFPEEEKSLAKYLWEKGWDVWLIELRGAGESRKPTGWQRLTTNWNIDHYALHDLPTAVKFILEKSNRPQLHWVGHSLGGLLVYPFVKMQSDIQIKSVVTAGTPITMGIKPGYWKWTSYLDPLFRVLPVMPYRMMAKFIERNPQWLYDSEDHALFAKENMDPETIRLGAQVAIDDVSSGVIRQVHNWMRHRHFKSYDGKVDYAIDPKKFNLPLLVLTGATDPFTPHKDVRRMFQKIGSKKKEWIIFGKEHGFNADYGHVDLIIGKHAPREVYPIISEWLEETD